jgi:hypothetical protein
MRPRDRGLRCTSLALGLVTSVVNPEVLLAVFSGAQTGSAGIDLGPFIEALQIAFAVGVVFSLLGAVVSAIRGGHQVEDELGQAVAACPPAQPASIVARYRINGVPIANVFAITVGRSGESASSSDSRWPNVTFFSRRMSAAGWSAG